MKKSEERVISEKIQKLTKESLLKINSDAFKYVDSGLCVSRKEALQYILSLGV